MKRIALMIVALRILPVYSSEVLDSQALKKGTLAQTHSLLIEHIPVSTVAELIVQYAAGVKLWVIGETTSYKNLAPDQQQRLVELFSTLNPDIDCTNTSEASSNNGKCLFFAMNYYPLEFLLKQRTSTISLPDNHEKLFIIDDHQWLFGQDFEDKTEEDAAHARQRAINRKKPKSLQEAS